MRILLVEDEVVVALSMELLLAEQGHRVVAHARDSRSALVLAHEKRPDLALVDVLLADGATGPELGRRLVAELKVWLIFMTANLELLPEDFAGALGVVPKPVADHVLTGAVAYVAERMRGRRPDRVPPGLILAPRR
jgi:two-component system, response regulator PdtaR